MTSPTDLPPDGDADAEARIARALAAARTDTRLRVQTWPDGPGRISRASRRRRMRHASLAVTTAAVLVLGSIGVGKIWLDHSLSAVQNTSLAAAPGAPKVVGKGHLSARPPAGQPFTVLILGTDSRAGTGTKYGTEADACGCSDTIILARVNPQTAKVSLLSVPRDTRVTVTGSGKVAKLNSAFDRGPDNSVATIESALSIDINHWVVLDLAGFKSIVDAIGGLKLDFPYPVKDANAGLDVEATGCQQVSGDEALAISRSRELKYLAADGKWTSDPTWEDGRQRREQTLMRVIAARAGSSSLTNPLTAAKVVNTFTDGNRLAVDNQVSTSELINLAGDFAGFDASTMQTFSLPTHTQLVDGADFELLEPAADVATIQAWYDAVLPPTHAATAPATAASATGTTGAASHVPGGDSPAVVASAGPTGPVPTRSAVPANQPRPFDPRPCS